MFQPRAIKKTFYWLVYFFLTCIKPGEAQKLNVSAWVVPTNISHFFLKTLEEVNSTLDFMRYCDTDSPIYDHDEFMSRVVSIHKEDGYRVSENIKNQIIAPGVFIDSNHILTSFAPFLGIAANNRYEKQIEKLYVLFYRAKWLDDEGNLKGYLLERVELTCGSKVNPADLESEYFSKEKAENRFWMGPDDMMVFQTDRHYEFVDKPENYHDTARNLKFKVIGPQKTKLAKLDDILSDKLKYVSLGMIDNDHIFNRNHLHTVESDVSETKAVVDCEEYVPFGPSALICIEDLENYVSIGSGALLFSNNTLFGVGSFTLKKGSMTIFVFTDVRDYFEVIFTLCTAFDGHSLPLATNHLPSSTDKTT